MLETVVVYVSTAVAKATLCDPIECLDNQSLSGSVALWFGSK